MNGSDNKETKLPEDTTCSSSALLSAMAQLIEQNNIIIEQMLSKDQMVLTLLEQNTDLLMQLVDEDNEPEGPQFLDAD